MELISPGQRFNGFVLAVQRGLPTSADTVAWRCVLACYWTTTGSIIDSTKTSKHNPICITLKSVVFLCFQCIVQWFDVAFSIQKELNVH